MSDAGSDPDVSRTVGELARALQDLQRELEPGDRRRLRPPSASELIRFTSDVAIPAAILVLQTNVRALQLLQRTLRLVEGRSPRRDSSSVTGDVRERAEQLTSETLSRLDGALADIGESIDAETDPAAADLLSEVRELRAELDDQIEAADRDRTASAGDERSDPDRGGTGGVEIDVESELQSIKDDLGPDEPGTDVSPGDDGAENGDDPDGEHSDAGSDSGDDPESHGDPESGDDRD